MADDRREGEQKRQRKEWNNALPCVYIRIMKSKLNPLRKAKLSPLGLARLEARYQQLKAELLQLGWIAQGSLRSQPPRAWCLTRKVKAKTVSLALSHEQAALFQDAITNQRRLENILRQMRQLSQQALLDSVPGVRKRARSKHPKPALS